MAFVTSAALLAHPVTGSSPISSFNGSRLKPVAPSARYARLQMMLKEEQVKHEDSPAPPAPEKSRGADDSNAKPKGDCRARIVTYLKGSSDSKSFEVYYDPYWKYERKNTIYTFDQYKDWVEKEFGSDWENFKVHLKGYPGYDVQTRHYFNELASWANGNNDNETLYLVAERRTQSDCDHGILRKFQVFMETWEISSLKRKFLRGYLEPRVPSGYPQLERGHRGDTVSQLQYLLARLKFRVGEPNIYDYDTERAVCSFQARSGYLYEDGKYGPKTEEYMYEVVRNLRDCGGQVDLLR